MLSEAKSLAKAALHRSGALALGRSLKGRDAFTVVLFHRILPDHDPRAKTADWNYTAKLDHFERFLDFVKRAYTVVSLKQVEDAHRASAPLPSKALLITFDDAWEDTARYAVPALEKRGLPSAIFVPTAGVGNDLLIWTDVAQMLKRAGVLEAEGDPVKAFEGLPAEERATRLRAGVDRAGSSVTPVMMSKAQFAALPKSVDLGAHSVNHIRFTELDDVWHELAGSLADLRMLTGAAPKSFAFPHGCYRPQHLGQAHKAGYQLLFTTVPCLNKLEGGRLKSPVIARITISDYDMLDRRGKFSESQLAYALLMRPARVLDDERAAA